jgi:hypothetical protein
LSVWAALAYQKGSVALTLTREQHMPDTKGGQISKQEAVRRALAHFGRDAKPAQMQGWIKQRFNIDMTTGHISRAKGEILRKAAAQKAAAKKAAAPKPQVQRAAASATPAKAAVPLADVLAVKDLVGRLGAGPLHTLIDAFAKWRAGSSSPQSDRGRSPVAADRLQ